MKVISQVLNEFAKNGQSDTQTIIQKTNKPGDQKDIEVINKWLNKTLTDFSGTDTYIGNNYIMLHMIAKTLPLFSLEANTFLQIIDLYPCCHCSEESLKKVLKDNSILTGSTEGTT